MRHAFPVFCLCFLLTACVAEPTGISPADAARQHAVAPEPKAPAPLENTYWRLMSLNGQPVHGFPNQTDPHLMLRDRGTAAGSDGCNNFFASWQSDGNNIRFSKSSSTLRICPQGTAQAMAMKDALDGADTWIIHDSVLELRQAGKLVALFKAVII